MPEQERAAVVKNNQSHLQLMVVGILLLLACGAVAQVSPPVDYALIFGDMENVLGAALVDTSTEPDTDLWHDHGGANGIWRSVPGQIGPGFVKVDNDGNGIYDDDHFAFLQSLLNAEGCTAGLNAAQLNNIRTSFDQMRAAINSFEITLSNIQIRNGGITVPNQNISITTGAEACIDTLIGEQCFDVPSLWGEDGVLNDADPRLDDYLRDLGAGYTTMGDAQALAYFQGLVAQIVIKYIPILVDNLLADLKSGGKAYVAPDVKWDFEKAYTVPCNQITTLTKHVCITDPIEICVDITVTNTDQCAAIQSFINNFNSPPHTSYGSLLAAGGNLNGIAPTNLGSYTAAGGVVANWLIRENLDNPASLVITTQPAGNYSGSGPGDPLCTGNWTFTVGMEYTNFAYTYYWYQGPNPGSLALAETTSVPQRVLTSLPYGITYHQVRIAGPWTGGCALPQVTSSTVGLRVVPPITFIGTPPTRIDIPDGEYYEDYPVGAIIGDSSPLTFTWYRKRAIDTDFLEYSVTNDGVLMIRLDMSGAQTSDSGQYYVHVSSDVYGHSVDSPVIRVNVVTFPTDAYDPLAQAGPQGRTLIATNSGSPATIQIFTGETPPRMNVNGTNILGEVAAATVEVGVATFRFEQVNVQYANVTIMTGSNRPLSILSAGDLNWGNVTITVPPGYMGGGAAGNRGLGGNGGSGGSGGAGGIAGPGGNGGSSVQSTSGTANAGSPGGNGSIGYAGTNPSGTLGDGVAGQDGTDGGAGFNDLASTFGAKGVKGAYAQNRGTPGAGGAYGTAGNGGAPGNNAGDNGSPTGGSSPTIAATAGSKPVKPSSAGSGQIGGVGGDATYSQRARDAYAKLTLIAGPGGGGGGGG
ncbi:MAG TPA: hypothetical protein PLI09_09115, partial [Candidatus Hydrogenedentes bacterium]|nr:hypothetical protein [Candidatus Hydrogenedentota bacterium]